MVKVIPLNTAIPVTKDNDDTYNYLYGITCGSCICVTLCVLIIFIIVYTIENDTIENDTIENDSDGSY